MVTIAEIIPLHVGVRIRLDDGKDIYLTRKELSESGYCAGMSLPEEDLRRFVRLHQYPRALNQAVAMLSRRPCSRHEIEKRLESSRFESEIVELVLYKLEKEKLLNDADFAEAWAHYRSGGRYGGRRILQELRQKGVEDDLARQAVGKLDEEDVLENAVHLASVYLRKAKKEDTPYKIRNRVIAALLRKGYDWDTASRAYNLAHDQNK